jgi:hypothetical protein
MGDIHILGGIGSIMNLDNIKPGVNLKELEKSMISGGMWQAAPSHDPHDMLSDDLRAVAKRLDISFDGISTKKPQARLSNNDAPQHVGSRCIEKLRVRSPDNAEALTDDDIDDILSPPRSPQRSPRVSPRSSPQRTSPKRSSPPRSKVSFADSSRVKYEPDDYDDVPVTGSDESRNDALKNDTSGGGASRSWSQRDSRGDTRGDAGDEYQTQEQYRRERIESVMGSTSEQSSSGFSFEKEKQEDLKLAMLATIDSLITALEDVEVDLSRIPKVDRHSSYDDVHATMKALRHKYDHAQYVSLAEEFVLYGAYALADIFDGKRTWWGYTPNLVGWHNVASVKMRRMKVDTGKFVSDFMRDYNIGPGFRLLLELIPSVFLYSKTKQQQHPEPGLFSDEEMVTTTNNIRGMLRN